MAWRLSAGAFCAASGLALPVVLASHGNDARCHAAELLQSSAAAAAAAAATDQRLAALEAWLQQQGADVEAIRFKQSDKDEGRYGVYASDAVRQRGRRSWLGAAAGLVGWGSNTAVPIAAFPMPGTLTAANLAQHPQQGPVLQELMQLGLVDDRTAVMLHLAVERLRLQQARSGGGHPTALAWLALLPETFSTTPYFSELDLQWLRGTTLHTATRLRQQSLREAWSRLRPAAAQLAQRCGLAGEPTIEDWVWANSVFWSRAIAFPGRTPAGGVEMQEGIVPGLDFCNHASPSPCYWTVSAAAAALKGSKRGSSGSEGSDAVQLVCPRRHLPAPGEEVTIDYGFKSNEELLFLYGFAIPDNPAEVLTVMCPLPPPGEWDELLRARLALLQRRGLRPQLHLPAADLPRLSSVEAGKDAAAAQRTRSTGSAGSSSDQQVLSAHLPEDVLATLEVFVMDPRQVAAELAASEDSADSAGGGGASTMPQRGQGSEAELSGQRMALLTTLVRLLEVKALEMEGEGGTGPLEMDQQLLQAAGDALPSNQRNALLYRMGQKALARAYVVHANRLLQQEMKLLARLQRE